MMSTTTVVGTTGETRNRRQRRDVAMISTGSSSSRRSSISRLGIRRGGGSPAVANVLLLAQVGIFLLSMMMSTKLLIFASAHESTETTPVLDNVVNHDYYDSNTTEERDESTVGSNKIGSVEEAQRASLGIPGTTQTDNGYDTELGSDPICWESTGKVSDHDDDPNSRLFENYLIKNFRLDHSVTLLSRCPSNNTLVGHPPAIVDRRSDYDAKNGEQRLRTGTWYNFTVVATLDLYGLGGNVFVSDDPINRVSFQVITCALGVSGFCSPFIHDESNARLSREGIYESPDVGDTHGDTHIHSPRVFVELDPMAGPTYHLNVTVPMLVNVPGEYFTIAAVQMFVAKGLSQQHIANSTIRYDMANALSSLHEDEKGDRAASKSSSDKLRKKGSHILRYQEPATILTVTEPVRIVAGVAIGLASLVILYLLYQTIRNRNHQVLQLTQGPFLVVFLVAALLAAICSFLFDPKTNNFCKYGDPLILMSLQVRVVCLTKRTSSTLGAAFAWLRFAAAYAVSWAAMGLLYRVQSLSH